MRLHLWAYATEYWGANKSLFIWTYPHEHHGPTLLPIDVMVAHIMKVHIVAIKLKNNAKAMINGK